MNAGTRPVRVLAVCTGNICRSPVAERLVAMRWGADGGDLVVSSAGTSAVVGDPIQVTMAHHLEQSGAYSGEFTARQLTPQMLAEADLVLGMTRNHRAQAVRMLPSAAAQTYTLREFARIAAGAADGFIPGDDPTETLRSLVQHVAASRGPVDEPEGDDISDPYGHDLEAYHVAFTDVADAIEVVARVLRGEPTDPPRATPPHSGAADERPRRGWLRRR